MSYFFHLNNNYGYISVQKSLSSALRKVNTRQVILILHALPFSGHVTKETQLPEYHVRHHFFGGILWSKAMLNQSELYHLSEHQELSKSEKLYKGYIVLIINPLNLSIFRTFRTSSMSRQSAW